MPDQDIHAVIGDRLIDGVASSPIEDGVVVIESNRIRDVGRESAVDVPDAAEVIEVDGTVMPGLLDLHLHLASHNVVSFKNHRVGLYETLPELQQHYGLHHARIMLDHGFTTLRANPWPTNHADDTSRMEVATRDAIDRGLFEGPRLEVGAFTHITNSHLDVILPRGAPREPQTWKTGWTSDGPDELRKMVREKLLRGVNFIKTVASGGGGTNLEPPNVRNMTQAEIDAVVDEAHAFLKHCSCHCFTPEAQRAAVEAGVDTVEHCVWTDEAALDAIEASGTPVVPTLTIFSDRALALRERTGGSEYVLEKMKQIQPYCDDTFKRFLERDITIAMGTDVHYNPEMGKNAMELELYVDLGMDEMAALKTATRNAAEAIGRGDELGTLEPGKLADLIVVDGDPLEDIALLQERENVTLVVKDGRVAVDRRPGEERFLFPDDEYRWDRVGSGREITAADPVDDLLLPEGLREEVVEVDVEYEMAFDDG